MQHDTISREQLSEELSKARKPVIQTRWLLTLAYAAGTLIGGLLTAILTATYEFTELLQKFSEIESIFR